MTKASTSPSRMAFIRSSASRVRTCRAGLRAPARPFREPFLRAPVRRFDRIIVFSGFLLEIQAEQYLLLVGEIADQAAHRERQFFYQSGDGHDLLATGERWLLEDIDDLQVIFTVEVRLADPFNVFHRAQRFRSR